MGQSMKKVERWKMEMPTEQEMLPKDKYTVFDRKVKRYRKGIHSKSHTISPWEYAIGVAERALQTPETLQWLTFHRGAKVDKGQSTAQSPGFLDRPCRERRSRACIPCIIIQFASDTALWKQGNAYCPNLHWHPYAPEVQHLSTLTFDEGGLLIKLSAMAALNLV
jgi:hypothetical protein